MKAFLAQLFNRMGKGPHGFVTTGDFSVLRPLYYRFQKGKEIIDLFKVLRKILETHGSIGAALQAHYEGDLRQALWNMRKRYLGADPDRLIFFFPKELPSNPLKRWNLYLRWMVRQDAIDAGIWNFMDKRDLVVPLDTHIYKIGRCLRWTARQSQSWAAACDITDALRKTAPDDPLKYDFFLCHAVGIDAGCSGTRQPACRQRCMVYEI